MEKTDAAAATVMKPSVCDDNPEDLKNIFDDSPVFVPEIEDNFSKYHQRACAQHRTAQTGGLTAEEANDYS